ncbi:hypothetical protein BST61_g6878 [Cercospora zeina]
MRAGGVYGWFGALPSWLQMDQACSEQQVRSGRAFSVGSATATASAGASTKRRSRAEALKCLEGRRLSSLTGPSYRNQGDIQPVEGESEGECEDDDPWSEDLPDLGRSRGKARSATLSASSRYSNESELQMQEKEVPLTLHTRTATVRTITTCHNLDNTASLRSQVEGLPSPAAKHSSFGRHIKTALRLSSNGSDQSSGLAEPRIPSAARLAHSRKEKAWGRCGTRYDWQCPDAPNAFSPQFKWPPSPYSQPANAPFGTQMAQALRQKRSGPHQTLGWNQPYWTPTIATPKDVYHRVERRPLLKKPLPFHDIELHQSVEPNTNQPAVAATKDAHGQLKRRRVLASIMICFTCLGLYHSFGVFQAYYTMHYPASNQTSISFVGSTQLAIVIGLCVLAANMRVVIRTGIVLGTALLSLGILCTSWCTSLLSIWLTQGFFAGFGMALALQAGFTATLVSFSGRAALLVLVLLSAGGYLGGIFYTLVTNELLVRYSFATAIRILAGVVLLALLPPVVMICLEAHQEASKPQSSPETRTFDFVTLLTALGIILVIFGLQFLPSYMPVFSATATDLKSSQGAHLLAIMCAAAVFGCSLASLAIHHGAKHVIIGAVCSVLSGIAVLVWLGIPARSSFGQLAVMSALYGLASSGMQVSFLAGLYASGQESNDIAGYRQQTDFPCWISDRLPNPGFAILTTIVSLAALGGNPLAGALIQSLRAVDSAALSYNFDNAKILVGVTLLVGGLILLARNYVRAERR